MLPSASSNSRTLSKPQLLSKAIELDKYLQTLSTARIAKIMNVSKPLSIKTKDLITAWTADVSKQSPAVNSFLGDIYSGLQAGSWTADEYQYADQVLRILSGLYGILRPNDGICPYRLEMGYKLPLKNFSNLYQYWGESIANTLPTNSPVINLSAVEYSKVVTDFIDPKLIITPAFYTINPKTNQPTFVTIHSKIARGALANWLIQNRVSSTKDVVKFNSIGYQHSAELSKPSRPAFVAKVFGGKGLSVRLQGR